MVVLVALVWVAAGHSADAQGLTGTPWNPTDPLPKFITHFFIDPANLIAIAKYRSSAGHPFTDEYENHDSSMKNYFEVLPQYLGTIGLVQEYAPVSGTIQSVAAEGQVLANGDHRGVQVAVMPDGYPQFQVILFHMALAPGLGAGSHITSGQPIGFADIRESIDVDLAVWALWNAAPLYPNDDGIYVAGLKAPGDRLVSPFDVMDDPTFALYAPYGLTDRSQMIVPLAYRNANPGQFYGNDLANLNPIEYFVFPIKPIIAQQPQSQFVPIGGEATFLATPDATGSLVTQQWYKNGVPIPGATGYNFSIYPAAAGDAGVYTVTFTSFAGSTVSLNAVLSIYDIFNPPPPSRLVNVSTRGLVPAGGALTAGFVERGQGSKALLIRAVGPGLASLGVTGFLSDPKLDVIAQGASASLLSNDNWANDSAIRSAASAVGAFALAPGSADAALLATLPITPGYSVRITPSGTATSGIALAEVYDTDPATSSARLINVSTLGFTGTGANVLTTGFVIAGELPKTVLVRVVGPGLALFNVPGTLADPQLSIFQAGSSGAIQTNDNWGDNGNTAFLQTVFASAGAFALPVGSKDAAIEIYLQPGAYTVQATGAGGTTGTVLIEVYDLDQQ